jgi:N-acetyl-anhydromuramyl-L-alanine amidase AmpD
MHIARVARAVAICLIAFPVLAVVGCASHPNDEIIIAGKRFHTGAPVVTWKDPGGYDAYSTKPAFPSTTQPAKPGENSPSEQGPYFSARSKLLSKQETEIAQNGWPLALARAKIDQFVYHYSVDPCSAATFYTLHDRRGLSVHFMLDIDGTIYQTLDVTERAWHATKANDRSVGIEIANIGAYPLNDSHHTLDQYYKRDSKGVYFVVPEKWQKYIRTPNFIPRPARQKPIIGEVQGDLYKMYDLTPQQYDSLIKLTAALCKALPQIKCDFPRDQYHDLIRHTLTNENYDQYHGLLGHYHVQKDKQDPGPAFQWDKVINGARKRMGLQPLAPGDLVNNPQGAARGK